MSELNERMEAARRLFQEGFNCAAAVVHTSHPTRAMVPPLSITPPYCSGGLLRRGKVCCAVSGAVMVLVMREGYLAGDQAAKPKSSELTSAFMEEYAQRQGTLYCREILAYNPRDAEELSGNSPIENQYSRNWGT